MITEDEAFWAGIAVATMMLGGGFSMLFLRALTGEGAIVLALGLLAMALTIQLRARPRRYVEDWTPYEAHAMTPTSPIESPEKTEEAASETQDGQQPTQPQEAAEYTEQPEPEPEPTQPSEQAPEQQPTQPEPTVEHPEEPPKAEKPEEEPIVIF